MIRCQLNWMKLNEIDDLIIKSSYIGKDTPIPWALQGKQKTKEGWKNEPSLHPKQTNKQNKRRKKKNYKLLQFG